MMIQDQFEMGLTRKTLKEFIFFNGNFTISTNKDIVDIHLLDNKFFVVKNGKTILIRKTFKGICNWIESTNTIWELQDEL